VWLGEYVFVLQLKHREDETEDPDVERSWFQRKVLRNATKQVRDTLRFLGEHAQIRITNERGHAFDIRGAEITEITKIVVFLGARALPHDCWQTRYYVSRTAGFMHVLAAHDYLGILEKLRVPEDIRRYFAYREQVIRKLCSAGFGIDESDIMGAYLSRADVPTPTSRQVLHRFVQDLEAFDLSPLIGDLLDHIERCEKFYDYYHIMLEFARLPRSIWREIKARFKKSLSAVQEREFTRPFRVAFPGTGCVFMIAPLPPQLPATGPAGEKIRVKALQNLTYAAMYDLRVPKAVGILISKDGEYVRIDWALRTEPWRPNPEMDAMLAENNPFRETKEKMINGFLFLTEAPP
jgi:hypothetical protein